MHLRPLAPLNIAETQAARRRVFDQAIDVYLKSFGGPLPESEEALREQIQWLDPDVQLPISEALYWFDFDTFVGAIRGIRGE